MSSSKRKLGHSPPASHSPVILVTALLSLLCAASQLGRAGAASISPHERPRPSHPFDADPEPEPEPEADPRPPAQLRGPPGGGLLDGGHLVVCKLGEPVDIYDHISAEQSPSTLNNCFVCKCVGGYIKCDHKKDTRECQPGSEGLLAAEREASARKRNKLAKRPRVSSFKDAHAAQKQQPRAANATGRPQSRKAAQPSAGSPAASRDATGAGRHAAAASASFTVKLSDSMTMHKAVSSPAPSAKEHELHGMHEVLNMNPEQFQRIKERVYSKLSTKNQAKSTPTTSTSTTPEPTSTRLAVTLDEDLYSTTTEWPLNELTSVAPDDELETTTASAPTEEPTTSAPTTSSESPEPEAASTIAPSWNELDTGISGGERHEFGRARDLVNTDHGLMASILAEVVWMILGSVSALALLLLLICLCYRYPLLVASWCCCCERRCLEDGDCDSVAREKRRRMHEHRLTEPSTPSSSSLSLESPNTSTSRLTDVESAGAGSPLVAKI